MLRCCTSRAMTRHLFCVLWFSAWGGDFSFEKASVIPTRICLFHSFSAEQGYFGANQCCSHFKKFHKSAQASSNRIKIAQNHLVLNVPPISVSSGLHQSSKEFFLTFPVWMLRVYHYKSTVNNAALFKMHWGWLFVTPSCQKVMHSAHISLFDKVSFFFNLETHPHSLWLLPLSHMGQR